MPRRGIATPDTPQHIENTQILQAYTHKAYLDKELNKLINFCKQKDGIFVFSLKTLDIADIYIKQLKRVEATFEA